MLLVQLGTGGGRVVVDDQAVDADGAQTRQHQLQRGIQRIAVDDDRTTTDQRPLGGGRDPRNDLTPTVVTTSCTRLAHPIGARLAPGSRSRAPGRLCVMAAPLVTLNDGNSIPAVGLGVFQIPPADTERAVGAALRAGYRHIDTAAAYRNERETGRAVADSDVPRDQLYVVTKLANPDQGYDSTLRAFDASMDRLGLEYLDLYLIHWPQPALNKFVDTFKAFAHLRDQGRIRSIGVSNFEPEHLTVLIDAIGIVPAVNQIELHPRFTQKELREVHAQRGIATEAWAPLGQGALLTHPMITAVAENAGGHPPRC